MSDADPATTAPAVPEPDVAPDALDLALVDELLLVEQASASDLFDSLLQRIAAGSALSLAPLQAAIDAGDLAASAASCHKLHGVAASFGLAGVAARASHLHAQAAAKVAPTPAQVATLADAVATGSMALRRHIAVARLGRQN